MEWIGINFIEAVLITWFISSLLDVDKYKHIYQMILFITNFSIITLSNYISMYDLFLTTFIILMNTFISYYLVHNEWYEILFIVCLEEVYNTVVIVLAILIVNIFEIQQIEILSKLFYYLLGIFIVKYLKKDRFHFNRKIYLIISFILYCLQFILGHFVLIFLILNNQLVDIYISFIILLSDFLNNIS